jgi:carboxyl-terminal processing protease
MHRFSTRGKALGVLVFIFVAFGAGLFMGLSKDFNLATAADALNLSAITGQKPGDVDFEKFWRAWNELDHNFVPSNSSTTVPTEDEKLWGAIAGLTTSYGDPYTVFLPPADAQIFQEDISGEFSGVGMELGTKDGQLTVVAPLKNSPAERAGIRTGDQVIGVDGKPTEGLAVDDAVKMIRGPKGTTVKLFIVREGGQPFEVTVMRDVIQVPVINNYKREDGIYVIELYSFTANSTELFRQALRDFVQSGATKLIFDLRGNPGGYLEAAVQMASFFLPVGDVVVTEDYQGKRDNIPHRSVGYNVFANRNLKMAILVDEGSASASEILAGALQQHHIATLVGTRTFGKGSVQELIELGGGAELKVTVARWLTPNGSSISDGGLKPDIEATRTPEDRAAQRDPQLDAAVNWIKNQ